MKKQAYALLAALVLFAAPAIGQGWNVELIGTLNFPGWSIKGVAQQGNYAYLAAQTAGLQIVDVSHPAAMALVGSLTGLGSIVEVMIANDYAYLATNHATLKIADVSDPRNPVLVGTTPLNGAIRAIDEEHDLAFVRGYDNRIKILDLSVPANPVEISSYMTTAWGMLLDLDVEGDYLYAYCQYGSAGEDYMGDSLLVLDVSDPANPTCVCRWDLGGMTCDIEVCNGYLYTVGYMIKFRILDVSDPGSPLEVGRLQTTGYPEGLAVSGYYAYLIGGYFRLKVIDCADPYNPTESGYFNAPGAAWDVAVNGTLAYTGESGSFEIYDCADAMHNDVDVTITPLIQPIQIPASGGSFDFYLFAENSGPGNQMVDLWTKVILPGGAALSPILGPVSVSLDSGTTGWIRHQSVPGRAAAGLYTYIACAGDYPNSIWASDSLQFIKLGLRIQDSGFGDWSNTGEEFGESDEPFITHNSSLITSISPNPFNPSTTISLELRAASFVKLAIYDVSGRLVATLVDGWRDAGVHEATFDGSRLASGIYLAKLETSEFAQVQKLVLMK